MTTSLNENTHTSVSIYLLYLNLAETEKPCHEPASANLEGYKLSRGKIYNQLNQNYGGVHPWLPAPATLFPPGVREHTERDHQLQSLGEKRGRE